MKIKVIREFLGIPKDSIGEVVEISAPVNHFRRCSIKFDFKDQEVIVPWPCEEYFIEVRE